MKQELQEKLFVKYPKLFKQKDSDMSKTCMCWGIEVGNGWYDLIDVTCSLIQSYCDGKDRIEVKSLKNTCASIYNNILSFLNRITNRFFTNHNICFMLLKYQDKDRPQVEFIQVKEKFGTLRMYVTPYIKEVEDIIWMSECFSSKICEHCGSMKDVTQTQGWITTICKECLDKKGGIKDV